MTGEFRRLGLAIKKYRQSDRRNQFMVVKQQNVAGGDQQVAYLDQSHAEATSGKVPSIPKAIEQGSKGADL